MSKRRGDEEERGAWGRVLTCQTPLAEIMPAAGGKGANLARLTQAGFAVPAWAVIPAEMLKPADDSKSAAEAAVLLDTLTVENAADVAAGLQRTLVTQEPAAELREAVRHAYEAAGGGLVAVRSSGAMEDGAEHSFAGQFESVLGVSGEQAILDAVLACAASAFSERSLVYRLENGLPVTNDPVSVIVQALVRPQVSGVLFTANPVTGDTGEIVVSATYGLGEALVSGAVEPDTITLDAETGRVLDTLVGEKHQRFDVAAEGGCEPHEVSGPDRDRLALEPRQLAELRELATAVAAEFGGPQDIEWAFADDRLWLLQTRPITALPTAGGDTSGERGEWHIWDNSNIIESFSGITSPLTFSAAADSYARVYREYARSLRVPEAQIRQMDAWLPVMLGHIHGRVYYNLLHWYRMVRIAPLYPVSRRVLEVSLGVEEPLDGEVARTLHPYRFSSSLRGLLSRAVTVAVFTRRLFTLRPMTDRFMSEFYAAYEVYDGVDYDALPGAEVHRRLRSVQQELIDRWGPMLVLDASLLLLVGFLYGLTMRWLPDAPDWFKHGVAAPGESVESAEPAHAMSAMAAVVREDPELRALVEDPPQEDPIGALTALDRPEFSAMVESYLQRYGYRSFDELKLETPDLREDPAQLMAMLRSALVEVAPSGGQSADDYLDEHLRGPRRFFYERLRRRASSGLADRERLRFCRTRAFGMVKRMLRAIGRDLVREGAIDAFEDVFLLRLEELDDHYDGRLAAEALRPLIESRRAERERDEQLVAPGRFETYGDAEHTDLMQLGWTVAGHADGAVTTPLELRGTPSSPGVVEGLAVVADRPQDAAGGILIAYRTDPGWVAVLPSASALLIERGSPLTHVAVVARELGVPTVVGIKDITRLIPSGTRLRVDAGAGTVSVLAAPVEVAT